MRRRTRGQSLVEMAFVLPILLILIFGIIDMSYYIYCYITVYQTTRDASEKASQQPPLANRVSPLDRNNNCVAAIIDSSRPSYFDAALMDNLQIRYPTTRALGEQVEVSLNYSIQPLTPLWRFVTLGSNGTLQVRATSRRTIDNLGTNPDNPSFTACS
ncbi:MAG TPA: TadE/TadG family type IV pilus assembly protein [Roseiflexaceae bacterium]|nr:TadE/TadG family type IV pilus assembly protein [Roseiflexaceae bacterium]